MRMKAKTYGINFLVSNHLQLNPLEFSNWWINLYQNSNTMWNTLKLFNILNFESKGENNERRKN
jgi:hypothetical protein